MDSTNIPKPWQYKNKWLVWPETVLDFMQLSDCDDDIEGICLTGKSVKECIDSCSKGCGAGYHILFHDTGSTVCVRLKTSNQPNMNPAFRLRRQSFYPELNDVTVSTYINTDFFPFPPELANAVFYQDILSLEEVTTGLKVGEENTEIDVRSPIFMSKGGSDNINLLPAQMSMAQIVQYQPVLYGDAIQFSVPGTSLLARESVNSPGMLEWVATTGMFYGNDLSFRIMPSDASKKVGDIVTYDDIFIIQYNNISVVVVSDRNFLEIVHDNLNDVSRNNGKSSFKFVSKMSGYYCDGKTCKKIPIKDIQTFGASGRYNGSTVTRNPSCFGVCDYLISGSNSVVFSEKSPGYYAHRDERILILCMTLAVILSIILIRIFRKSI